MIDTLPFANEDTARMERERDLAIAAFNEELSRTLCVGCAENWPVTRADRISDGLYPLIHTGKPEDGACWCQCPHLHPENAGAPE